MSITIATFSFAELVYSIVLFVKSKKTNDILLQTFKGCSLVSSCYAIVLTQVALRSAMKATTSFYNALSGVFFGAVAIVIGQVLLVSALKFKTKKMA